MQGAITAQKRGQALATNQRAVGSLLSKLRLSLRGAVCLLALKPSLKATAILTDTQLPSK